MALKQVILYWTYIPLDLGPKDQKCGPVKAVAAVTKYVFPTGQISYNIKSV